MRALALGTLVALVVAVGVAAAGPGPTAVAAGPADGGGPSSAVGSGTHGSHLSVDPQLSGDGTVVLETLFVLRPGFVVLHADDGGRPGEPIGVTALDGGQFRTDVSVSVNRTVWERWEGNRTVWAVLHADADGDDTFDPGTDPPMTTLSPAAQTSFILRKTDGGATRVLAAEDTPLSLNGSALSVRRVDLATSGHVVVETTGGERVGHRRLAAGTHENVSVALDESFLADQSGRFQVRVVAYEGDGDGTLDAGDIRVTAAGSPVATYVVVERDGEDDEPLINTPAGTPIPSETPTATATPSPTTPDDPATTDRPTVAGGPTHSDESGGSGPGPGALGALAALALVALALAAVRRR